MSLFHANKNLRTVWELYNATVPQVYDIYHNPSHCLYCGSPMRAERAVLRAGHPWEGTDNEYVNFALCDCCGWWSARRCLEDGQAYLLSASSAEELSTRDEVLAACGTLAELSGDDLAVLSLEEVRGYLAANGEALADLSSERAEEIVAAVYTNAGYRTELVGRSGDGGIDIILLGKGEELVGVQVKRYKNTVGVDAIREFMGALYVGDFVRGVFVTTSSFTRGAREYASRLAHKRAFPIELVDGDSLLSLLRVRRDRGELAVEAHPAMKAIIDGTAPMTKVLEARNSWGSFSNLRLLLGEQLRAVTPTGEDASLLPINASNDPDD